MKDSDVTELIRRLISEGWSPWEFERALDLLEAEQQTDRGQWFWSLVTILVFGSLVAIVWLLAAW